jgi:hypothetical protein
MPAMIATTRKITAHRSIVVPPSGESPDYVRQDKLGRGSAGFRPAGAAGMGTGAIDVRRFFHGFALGAAVSPFGYFTTTDRVFAFFGCHFVSLLD